MEKHRQLKIIKDIHEGIGKSTHSKAMASHKGRDSTYSKISERFFWYSIYNDVENYIKACEICQKQGDLKLKSNSELQSIPVPVDIMKQVGVNLCTLPEVDGYFSKWSEVKPIKDKTAPTIAQFLYEIMCRHGCFAIQINDQGREFVNEVSDELHRLTGVVQRMTSAYHPQSNGLVERQNRTIKNSLVKILEDNPRHWPYIMEGVLFAHRVSKYSSTKYSPFKLLYNREPVLPIDVKYRLSSTEISKCDEPFYQDIFDAVLASCNVIREEVHKQAGENIKRAQEKQQRDYAKRNNSSVSNDICIGAQVLLRNNKRNDRKRGKFCFKWIGPYVVSDITKRGLVTLKNKDDKELKKKFNKVQLKSFSRNLDVINECQELSGGENNEGVNEVIQNNIKDTMENSKILDEKPAKIFHSNSQIQDEKPPRVINYWDNLPDEIVEKILLESIKNSDYMCKTYNNVLNTCTRFQMVKRIGEKLLPRIYIREDDAVKKSSFNGKFKVSVRKLIKLFGQVSGLIKRVRN